MSETNNNLVLSIVIPAYNEEEAIASICERCIAAKPEIIGQTDVDDVEITVVSDGSHDRTAEIAAGYKDQGIQLIAYEKNRGYGAAIKTGYAHSRGQLLSFLDADGTCDPLFFINLVNNLRRDNADISLGSRLGPESQMPAIRRLGNYIFATLLGILSNTPVGDTASGMRVMTRESLAKLGPLPDGLNYTPAMSAKALFDDNIAIVEEPMSYKERIGKSKLSVVKDGLRFLRIILDVALTYRPVRLLGLLSLIFILIALGYSVDPFLEFSKTGTLDLEERVYRVITIMVLVIAAATLYLSGLVAESAVGLTNLTTRRLSFTQTLRRGLLSQRNLLVGGPILVLLAFLLNAQALYQYLTMGAIEVSWSLIAAGGILVLLGIEAFATGVLLRAIALLKEHQQAMQKETSG